MALRGYKDAVLASGNPKDFHTVILRRLYGKALRVETESLSTRVAVTRVEVDKGEYI